MQCVHQRGGRIGKAVRRELIFQTLKDLRWLVQSGEMGVGELFNFMMLTAFVGSSIGGMAEQFVQIQKTLGSIERVLDIIDMPMEIEPITKSEIQQSQPQWDQALHIQNLYFHYPSRPENEIIKGLNIDLNPGETLAT